MNIIWIDVIEANRMKIETKRLRARELFEYKRKMVYNFTGSNFFEIQKPTSQWTTTCGLHVYWRTEFEKKNP